MANNEQPKMTSDDLAGLPVAEIKNLLPGKNLVLGGGWTDGKVCLMEAVAYISGEDVTDEPKCACPALTNVGIAFNDSHSNSKYTNGGGGDNDRNSLIAAIPALVGSKTKSAKVRFKRAKAAASLILSKALTDGTIRPVSLLSKALYQSLDDMAQISTKRDLDLVCEILNYMDENGELIGVSGEVVRDSLDNLQSCWDSSNGITEQEMTEVFSDSLFHLFDKGKDQADFLREIGYIRS